MTQPENITKGGKREISGLDVLIVKAANSDSSAMYELCERVARDVLFRAAYIMGNQTDAEDVTQEVLLRLCKNIKSLRDAKVFKMWLGKIIANEANRFMAEKSRRGVVLDIDDYLEAIMEEKDDFLPQECAENEEQRKAVVEIIGKLPMRQREAIIFHYYDGLSVTDTAETMGVSWQCVSEYLALAREKVKRGLEKQHLGIERLGGMAALPLSAILGDAFHRNSETFIPANQARMQQTLTMCKEYIQAIPTVPAAASGSPFWLLTGLVASVVTVTAVVAGMTLNAAPRIDGGAQIDSKVIFSGGVDYGANVVYVNPTRAEPEADNTNGDMTVVQWWITKAGDDAELYSGEGDVAEDALIRLRETGGDGEYMIFFVLKDKAGDSYKLSSNFYILDESS